MARYLSMEMETVMKMLVLRRMLWRGYRKWGSRWWWTWVTRPPRVVEFPL